MRTALVILALLASSCAARRPILTCGFVLQGHEGLIVPVRLTGLTQINPGDGRLDVEVEYNRKFYMWPRDEVLDVHRCR